VDDCQPIKLLDEIDPKKKKKKKKEKKRPCIKKKRIFLKQICQTHHISKKMKLLDSYNRFQEVAKYIKRILTISLLSTSGL
jgi:hypothetical protein